MTRTRVAFLPRRNYARSSRYYFKRVMRIAASPHAIAAGVAAGTFASFTPFMGLHFILSFVLAYLVRGSMLAAALGTAVGNPLTFPAIWALTHSVGSTLLGLDGAGAKPRHFGEVFRNEGWMTIWETYAKPMIVGGIPTGLAAAALFYVATYFAVRSFKRRKQARTQLRAHQRLQKAANAVEEAGAA